jgi:hypothetical protein
MFSSVIYCSVVLYRYVNTVMYSNVPLCNVTFCDVPFCNVSFCTGPVIQQLDMQAITTARVILKGVPHDNEQGSKVVSIDRSSLKDVSTVLFLNFYSSDFL